MTNCLLMGDDASGSSTLFSLPTGTVTFILTDIEASSRKWEADADAMGPAVAHHYEIIDAAVARWGGVRPIEQGEGDSTVAAFSRASDAAEAALEAQRLLVHDLGEHFAVRIALHTGDAQLRDEGNYFGHAVIRGARLRSCGHGGQILVSNATGDLIAERLPKGAELLDLGTHRLKDLHRPERVFELCHADLPRAGAFPPLRSLDAFRHNLPPQLTPLIGREHEMVEVIALVQRERLVTLTGTGGCGKSRLAAESAARLADRFPGGVWWCELAAYRDEGAVMDALAGALGVVQSPGRPLAGDVTERLRANGPTLAVLDNAEHLLDAVARAATELLSDAPDVRVIVTSREPLSISGEVSWRVPSLPVPPVDAPPIVDQLEDFAAVSLFIERATRSRAGFTLSDENASAVVSICRRLDGIPLAIELAAARVRTLSPERIAAQLDDRFRLLTGGSRTLLPRQQTLLASVAWSEALLDESERAALRRIGVFVGGFALEGAEAVLGSFEDTDPYEVFDLVGRLVDKSLVQMDDATGRYRMLETIRSFALARLLEANEGDVTRDAHLAWSLDFASEREAAYEYTAEWMASVSIEWPNLSAALDWAYDRPEQRCALVAALGAFWLAEQRVEDGVAYAFDSIERFAAAPPPSWYRAVANATILTNAGLQDELAQYVEQARAPAEAAGDAQALLRLDMRVTGRMLHHFGPTPPVREAFRALEERAVALGDTNTALNARWLPYQFLISGGRVDEADELAAGIFRNSRTVNGAASAAMNRGELDRAAALLREAAALAQLHGVKLEEAMVASNCRRLALLTGGGAELPTTSLDLSDLAGFTGMWAMVHAAARLTDIVRDGRWGDVDEFASPDFDWMTEAPLNRTEELLIGALAAAGRRDTARARAQSLLERSDRWNFPRPAAEARLALAELDESPEHAYDALALAAQYGLVLAQVDALELLALEAVRTGDPERAARLKASAAATRDSIGYRFRWPTRASALDIVDVPETTPVDALDDAVAFALRGRGERRRPAFGWNALTPAELDVAYRVSAGHTTPQVAKQLHVSPSTVKTHLDHIYAKLGINSRAALASEAARHSDETVEPGAM